MNNHCSSPIVLKSATCWARRSTRPLARYTTRSDPYFGARTSIAPPLTRCTCRVTASAAPTTTGQTDRVSGVRPNDAVPDGGTEHRPYVDVPGLDRARGESRGVHRLDPHVDIRATDLPHRFGGERHRPSRERHREHRAGSPDLSRRPLAVERGERDLAGLGVSVCAGDHGRSDLVQPLLGVDLAAEVPC